MSDPTEIIEIPDGTPQAHSVRIMQCGNPKCLRPHVVLFDNDNNIMAHFVPPDTKPNGSGFAAQLFFACVRATLERGER